jgi:hypothetical protein
MTRDELSAIVFFAAFMFTAWVAPLIALIFLLAMFVLVSIGGAIVIGLKIDDALGMAAFRKHCRPHAESYRMNWIAVAATLFVVLMIPLWLGWV